MPDDTRYHYDKEGNYLGKSSSSPPAAAGGGCCGLLILIGLGWMGMRACEGGSSSPSYSSSSSSSYSAPSSSSRSARSTSAATTRSTEAAPAPEPVESTSYDDADIAQDAGCRSMAYAIEELEDGGDTWLCFPRKKMAWGYKDECMGSGSFGPVKKRVSGRKRFCVTD